MPLEKFEIISLNVKFIRRYDPFLAVYFWNRESRLGTFWRCSTIGAQILWLLGLDKFSTLYEACFDFFFDSASKSTGEIDGTDPLRVRLMETGGINPPGASVPVELNEALRVMSWEDCSSLLSYLFFDSSLLMTICGTALGKTSPRDGYLIHTVLLCFEISSTVFFSALKEYELGGDGKLRSWQRSRMVVVVVVKETFRGCPLQDSGLSIWARDSTGDSEGDRPPDGGGAPLLGSSGDRLGEELGDRLLLIWLAAGTTGRGWWWRGLRGGELPGISINLACWCLLGEWPGEWPGEWSGEWPDDPSRNRCFASSISCILLLLSFSSLSSSWVNSRSLRVISPCTEWIFHELKAEVLGGSAIFALRRAPAMFSSLRGWDLKRI